MLTLVLGVALASAVLAYLPLVLLVLKRDRTLIARRRPINEVLRDALAEGRITQEEWEARMDEVHRSMPSLDAPYPRAREFEEHRL